MELVSEQDAQAQQDAQGQAAEGQGGGLPHGSTPLRRLLIWPIRFYRYFLSPWIGQSCRFTPTCSVYTMEAIETHGAGAGVYLGFKRICRCHPFSPGGLDPVPPVPGAAGRRTVDTSSTDHSTSKPPV
jgi:putative membrane protein insertion efficiency factor